MSRINKSVSALKKKQEQEKKKEKTLKAIIISSVSLLAVAAIILLAVFVIKPAIEKKQIEKEREQATSVSVESSADGYAEYRGCRMPEVFVQLLLQADADSEAVCKESGVAAEIGDYKLSVPEYAFHYYRAEIDQLFKAVKSNQEKGGNFTGFDPSKAPSAQNYPKGQVPWDKKLSDKFSEELSRKIFAFDEAIKAGFVPDDEVIASINNTIEYISTYGLKGKTPDEYISESYFEGLTFAMFIRSDIITQYADAYAKSLQKEKEKSYTDSFVDGVFNNSPKKYKNVTVNIFPIENTELVDEARSVKDLSGFRAFTRKALLSRNIQSEAKTESYKVTYKDIAEHYGDTVADWIFSSERKAGDTGVVAGAVYNCLIYLNELPQVTSSSDILFISFPSDETKTIDGAYQEAEKIYKELGGDKMTEAAFREYALANTEQCEFTVYVNDLEVSLDEWVHSKERKKGDSICLKGRETAYIVMFLKDNPDDTFAAASIRKEVATEEVEKFISGSRSEFSANERIAKKSIEAAEKKYLEYYNTNKEDLGI